MSKIEFKSFVRLHPELANSVINNKITWQKLYELYELYGEKSSVWNDFLIPTTIVKENNASVGDFIKTIKNVDLDTVQKGIENIQKTIDLLQDIGIGAASKSATNSYQARPMYRYFDD